MTGRTGLRLGVTRALCGCVAFETRFRSYPDAAVLGSLEFVGTKCQLLQLTKCRRPPTVSNYYTPTRRPHPTQLAAPAFATALRAASFGGSPFRGESVEGRGCRPRVGSQPLAGDPTF